MPAIVRGRIVYPKVAISDPQGQNPKDGRPFVVISRRGSRTRRPKPTAKSGLRQKSAALCTWLIEIAPNDVEVGRGHIRADIVEEIVRKTLLLKSIPQAIETDEGK